MGLFSYWRIDDPADDKINCFQVRNWLFFMFVLPVLFYSSFQPFSVHSWMIQLLQNDSQNPIYVNDSLHPVNSSKMTFKMRNYKAQMRCMTNKCTLKTRKFGIQVLNQLDGILKQFTRQPISFFCKLWSKT